MSNVLPFGEMNDEVGLGILAIVAKKVMPSSRAIADKILTIEAYRIGELKLSGMLGGGSASSTNFNFG